MNLTGPIIRDNVMNEHGHSAKRLKREISGSWCAEIHKQPVNHVQTTGIERNVKTRTPISMPFDIVISQGNHGAQEEEKAKLSRDPTSHRIIEKMRPGRMNNRLAELCRLIPQGYFKQGQGHIGKTEIIEMACKLIRNYMQNLHNLRAMPEARDMKSDDSLSSSENTYSSDSSYQGLNISENIMKMICQDEHLCTLLKPITNENSESETSGYCSSGGELSMSDNGMSSYVTLQSVQSDSAEKVTASGSVESQYFSKQDSLDGSMANKDCWKYNVYKFKNDIINRFSEERKSYQMSDTSSNDQREEDNDRMDNMVKRSQGTDSRKENDDRLDNIDRQNQGTDSREEYNDRLDNMDRQNQGTDSREEDKDILDNMDRRSQGTDSREDDNDGLDNIDGQNRGTDSREEDNDQLNNMDKHSQVTDSREDNNGRLDNIDGKNEGTDLTEEDNDRLNNMDRQSQVTDSREEYNARLDNTDRRSQGTDSREEDNDRLDNMDRRSQGTDSRENDNDRLNNMDFDSKKTPLPAFVLHPLGTHYVPVTIDPSYFQAIFASDTKALTQCHPIIIKVNCFGPIISIHPQFEQNLLVQSEE